MIFSTFMRHKRPLLAGFSAILLIIIIRVIGLQEILDAFVDVDKALLAGALALFAGSIAVGALRWKSIIGLTDTRPSFPSIIKLVLVDKFANSFLPTAAAGMALRTVLLNKDYGIKKSKGLATIVLDYGIDIFGTFILAVPCYIIIAEQLSEGIQRTFRTSLLTIAVAAVLVFVLSNTEFLISCTDKKRRVAAGRRAPFVKKMVDSRTWKKFKEFSATFGVLLANRRLFVETMGLTFAKVILDARRITVLFYAFGISVPFYYFILFDSAWTFLSPLMFTPGGIGVVETGRIALYSLIPAVSSSETAPIVFLDRLITFWLMTLCGAVVFFSEGIDISSASEYAASNDV